MKATGKYLFYNYSIYNIECLEKLLEKEKENLEEL